MSARQKTKRPERTSNARPSEKKFPTLAVLVLAVALVAGVFLWRKHAGQPDTSSATAQAPAVTATNTSDHPSTNAPFATTTKPEFQKLKGRWLRPDGGYVLEIRSIDSTGAVD